MNNSTWRIILACGFVFLLLDVINSLIFTSTPPWHVHIPMAYSYGHHISSFSMALLLGSMVLVACRSVDVRLRASLSWLSCFIVAKLRYIHALPSHLGYQMLSRIAGLVAILSLLAFLVAGYCRMEERRRGSNVY